LYFPNKILSFYNNAAKLITQIKNIYTINHFLRLKLLYIDFDIFLKAIEGLGLDLETLIFLKAYFYLETVLL